MAWDLEGKISLMRQFIEANREDPEAGFPVSGDAIAVDRDEFAQVLAAVEVGP